MKVEVQLTLGARLLARLSFDDVSCSHLTCCNMLSIRRKGDAGDIVSVLADEESLLVLSSIVDDTDCSRVVRNTAVFDESHVVAVVATSVAVNPVQLNADLRR